MLNKITLPLLDDLHVHLRQDEMLEFTVAQSIRGGAGRVMVMPNLKPPIANADQAIKYRKFGIHYVSLSQRRINRRRINQS
jgi:dihydroorotase